MQKSIGQPEKALQFARLGRGNAIAQSHAPSQLNPPGRFQAAYSHPHKPTMINLLIIAHETLGTAYTALARHILPLSDFSHIHQLHVQPDDAPAAIIQRAQDRLARTAPNHGTLILTDIFGATPCNAALKLVIPRQTSMVTGLNAPMLVKALTHCAHSTDLARFTETVQQAGINGILAFTEPPDGGA